MNAMLDCEALRRANLAELRAALQAEGMPATDLASAAATFYRFHSGGQTLAFAGIEGEGTNLLLRSMWIAPGQRSRGVGNQVLERIEELARSRGAETLHLLTTTAERFFARHGFVIAARAQAPAGISASQEFRTLCPASAIYMTKSLGGGR